MDDKERVAEAAALLAEDGMRIGLGSGSTARLFVAALGRRVAAGLSLAPAVLASRATAEAALSAGLPLADMTAADAPVAVDLAVDGTDEIDPAFRLVKGGGASLLREKIVARMAARFVVIADGTKSVAHLGRFPLPVEVLPFAWTATAAAVGEVARVAPVLRRSGGAAVVTDNGNLVLDVPLGRIGEPEALAAALAAIPGVVEHGLFLDEADEALIASGASVEHRFRRR
jgi:ribose 5-phosphate isomerase A